MFEALKMPKTRKRGGKQPLVCYVLFEDYENTTMTSVLHRALQLVLLG